MNTIPGGSRKGMSAGVAVRVIRRVATTRSEVMTWPMVPAGMSGVHGNHSRIRKGAVPNNPYETLGMLNFGVCGRQRSCWTEQRKCGHTTTIELTIFYVTPSDIEMMRRSTASSVTRFHETETPSEKDPIEYVGPRGMGAVTSMMGSIRMAKDSLGMTQTTGQRVMEGMVDGLTSAGTPFVTTSPAIPAIAASSTFIVDIGAGALGDIGAGAALKVDGTVGSAKKGRLSSTEMT